MKLFVLISQAFARGCAPACLAATGPLVVIMSFTIDPASVPACVRGVPSEGTGLSIPHDAILILMMPWNKMNTGIQCYLMQRSQYRWMT